MRLRTGLSAASLVVVATAYGISASAQDSVIQHPADIRAGSCASFGEVVAPLAPLVVPDGETVGQAGASAVEQSVTEVPLLLADLLSENSAIAVHASPDQVGTPIACGEIGGALAADGSLSVGLQAMNGAKLSGVGNREVGPTTTDPTNATGVPPGSSLNPGADGVVDRPGRDRVLEGEDGNRSGTHGDVGIARAGEDGTSQ
jgi:hypothetical protein